VEGESKKTGTAVRNTGTAEKSLNKAEKSERNCWTRCEQKLANKSEIVE